MLERHRFYRQLLRQRFALLHLKKIGVSCSQRRRYIAIRPNTPPSRKDPPAAVVDPLRRQTGIDKRGHHRPQQNANRQAGRQRAAGDTNAFFRDMLSDKHPGARNFTADRRSLQNTHQQQ